VSHHAVVPWRKRGVVRKDCTRAKVEWAIQREGRPGRIYRKNGPGSRLSKNPESMDAQGESADALWRQKGIDGPRWRTAVISEEMRSE
jgi:hypothetical protein